MKAIILAGGHGTRLAPITTAVNKHLLPVHDKPMIYYPLSVLMLAGIRDILVVCRDCDLTAYQHLLGDGERFGVAISYALQSEPKGIAEALIIGEHFLANGPCCLILGDNFFFGEGLGPKLREAAQLRAGAAVFAYQVADPERFGVISFDEQLRALTIAEKPRHPKSDWAVTGLYFFDHQAPEIARHLRPSSRGELEITSLNRHYLTQNELRVFLLGRGSAWLDMGTSASLQEAGAFVQMIEQRQGLKIACLEEIALKNGWIDADSLKRSLPTRCDSEYYRYVRQLVT